MHAASRYKTSSLASLPKDGGVSCFGRSSGRSPIHNHSQNLRDYSSLPRQCKSNFAFDAWYRERFNKSFQNY